MKIAGLQLWIHGWQFPEAGDHWDGNWLRATARCARSGASVLVSGALMRITDLMEWAQQCGALRDGGAQEASLAPLEPELRVTVRPLDRLGHLVMTVEITPEHLTQAHRFDFEIDQTALPQIARQCRDIAAAYPERGV